MESSAGGERIDLDKLPYDQTTFLGRIKYFAWVTDFRSALTSSAKLNEAKQLLEQYKNGTEPAGTTEEELWHAKKLVLSAFHPDSGDLQNFIGRMSFQVPGGMILTGGMMHFYKSNTAVIFWQWMNQSFNALVNYTNRNAASTLTNTQIGVAYVSATTCALVTSLGLKAFLAKRASPLTQRFVPFVAVAAANMVNIPLTRQSELVNGVTCKDENGNPVTQSQYAASKAISQVVCSRIFMAVPPMTIMPLVVERLERRAWFMRYSALHLPFQTFMVGAFLIFMVPMGCALFPQRSSIHSSRLSIIDNQRFEEIKKKKVPTATLR